MDLSSVIALLAILSAPIILHRRFGIQALYIATGLDFLLFLIPLLAAVGLHFDVFTLIILCATVLFLFVYNGVCVAILNRLKARRERRLRPAAEIQPPPLDKKA